MAQNMELGVSFEYISEKEWDPNDGDKIVMGEDVRINLNVANVSSGRLAYRWDFGGGDIRDFGVGSEVEDKAFGNFVDCTAEYEFRVTVQDTFAYRVNDTLIVDSVDEVTETFNVMVWRRPNPILWDEDKDRFSQFSNCQDFDITNPTYEVNTSIQTNDGCAVEGTHIIDWGDGTRLENLSTDSEIPMHTFTEIRAYDMYIEVQGSNGLTGRTEYQIRNESNPAANFGSVGNTTGCAPIDAHFEINITDLIKNSPGNIYIWNFNDDTETIIWDLETLIANNGEIDHVFSNPTYYFNDNNQLTRRHIVSLTAVNSCDNTPFSTPSVKVGGGPESMFIMPDTVFCASEPVEFINQSLLGLGYDASTENTFVWNFGDGSPEQIIIVNNPNELVPIYHTYTAPGTYIVSLESENQCATGDEKSLFVDTVIIDPFPVSDFVMDNDGTTCGLTTMGVINASSNMTIGAEIGSYWEVEPMSGGALWHFESGDKWSQSPVFSFDTAGIYTVKYFAKNACVTDYSDTTIIITDLPVISGDFPAMACKNGEYETEQIRLDDNFGTITSILWETDSTSIVIANPDSLHAGILFTQTGTFPLKLTVENECGAVTRSIQVLVVEDPIAINSSTSLSGIPGHQVDFVNASTGGELSHTYLVNRAGYRFESLGGNPGDTAIIFESVGNYEVQYIVSNFCGADTLKYDVRINDKPGVDISLDPFQCDSFRFVADDWVTFSYSEEETIDTLIWSILPDSGWRYMDGTDSLSLNPQVQFFDTDRSYKIGVEFSTNLYKGAIRDSSEFYFYESPVINFTKNRDTLCLTDTLVLFDRSIGDQLIKSWNIDRILPDPDSTWRFISQPSDNSHSVIFSEWGTYMIALTIENPCGTLIQRDTVYIQDVPEALPFFPPSLCLDQTNTMELPLSDFFVAEWKNNVPNIAWDIKPLNNGQVTFVDGTNSNTELPVILIEGSDVYRFKWSYSTPCDGNFTDSADVEVFSAPPPALFSINTTIGCAPFTPVFTLDTLNYQAYEQANVPLTYKWYFGNGDSATTLVPPADLILNQGLNDTTYTVSFIVGNLCFSDTFRIPIKVLPKPTGRFEMMHEWECSPVNVQFKNLSEGSPDSYYWDFGNGNTSVKKNPSNLFTTDTLTRKFTITLVTGNLCGVDTTQKDIVIRPQTVDAHFSMNPRVVCAGTPVYFENFSTDTSSFIRKNFWDFGDGNVDTSRNETSHVYMEPGKYYIKLTVNNYCGIDTLIDSIIVEPTPEIHILSPDTVCADVPINFTVETDVPIGAYRWNFGDGDSSKLTAPEYNYINEGDYLVGLNAVSAVGVFGCSSYIEKSITVHPTPDDRIFPEDTSGCSPFVYKPKAIGDGGYHLWNFGADTVVTANPIFRYENRSGNIKKYTVTLVTENDFGCAHQEEATVSVLPQPQAGIDSAEVGESPRQLHLFNITQNATNCVWIYENGDSIKSCDDQVRYFSENGNFTIKLITTNQYGCSDVDSIGYEPGLNSGLFFPNAFAPNLDDQNARVFKAYGIGVREYELKVYDRWNNVVWETNDLNNSQPSGFWDGNDAQGRPLPHGVYYWVCRAKMYGKENEPYDNYNGTVYLIR